MDMNESCPQCAGSLTNGTSRLVQDTCGHRKCRLCLLNDESSCKQCVDDAVTKENTTEIDCHTAVITYQKKSDADAECSNAIRSNSPEHTEVLDQTVVPVVEDVSKDIPINTVIDGLTNPTGINKPIHVSYDHTNQEYKCNICNRLFTAKSQIRYHIYCSGGKKPFNCDICNKGFIVKSHYTTHLLAHKNLKPYKCVECGKTFYERSKLNRHRLTHATTRPFVCQDCGKTFKIKENLRTHSLIHKNEKPYECTECGLKFSHSSNLKKHLSVHTSDKAHMCDQCGKRFKLKWALTLHRRAHSKNRPNKCSTCSKSFVHNKDLIRHELIHADSKGFRCGICGTTFKRKDNLNRHARNTHPGKKAQIVKCVDNPNAIKVITSPPICTGPVDTIENVPIVTTLEPPTIELIPEENRINAPLKLAFKTPSFKNHYNIHRDYVAPQEDEVNIYEKILMPRSPATRISTLATTPASVLSERDREDESNILCQRKLGPFNAPSHYETSFDNKKHAVIKNIKFKLPAKYTNLNSRDTVRDSNIINSILNRDCVNDTDLGRTHIGHGDNSQAGTNCDMAATSVIVNSTLNQAGNQTQDNYWRKKTAQYITAND